MNKISLTPQRPSPKAQADHRAEPSPTDMCGIEVDRAAMPSQDCTRIINLRLSLTLDFLRRENRHKEKKGARFGHISASLLPQIKQSVSRLTGAFARCLGRSHPDR